MAVVAGVFGQRETDVKTAQVATKKVMLHPLDPTTRVRDATQSPYTFLLLQARPDHDDYDEGMEMWVAKLVAQVEIGHPVGLYRPQPVGRGAPRR
jgi:hypothetical protein